LGPQQGSQTGSQPHVGAGAQQLGSQTGAAQVGSQTGAAQVGSQPQPCPEKPLDMRFSRPKAEACEVMANVNRATAAMAGNNIRIFMGNPPNRERT
jgi:hypothetical protein